jgi:hypothetical protein
MNRSAPIRWIAAALAAGGLLIPAASGKQKFHSLHPGNSQRRLVEEKSGKLAAREGQRLRLVTDLGDVHIHTQQTNEVSFRVRVETDQSAAIPDKSNKVFLVIAANGPEGVVLHGRVPRREDTEHLWITFDVTVPAKYSLEVNTGAGTIDTQDAEGHVLLTTAGGDITTGNVNGIARLETGGGHIHVKDVSEDLTVGTGGGHISVGKIGRNAILHTGGGHIHLGSVGGIARLDTGGGNVSLEHAGAGLVATTSGGQIEVGEAWGAIRAQTGGGGIRVARLAGPTQLETGDGSIYLTQVQSPVRASTGTGGITAWFGPDAKLAGSSELESGDGDIVVYLPKVLAVTIDAQIQLGDEHHVIADPAFPLKVSYVGSEGGARVVRAEGALNGGGGVLKLRTVAGNIRLILSDTCLQLQKQIYKQQMEHLQRQMEVQMRTVEKILQKPGAAPAPAPAAKAAKPDKPD